MRYVMKQKLFSLSDNFRIQDADGNDVFYVDGKIFSLGDKLSFHAMDGTELGRIQQKLLSIGPTYEITRTGEHAATLKKKLFTLFRDKFEIDVPGPDDLVAQGSFLDYEYSFTRHGTPVAQVSKQFFSFRDTYGIDIAEGEDDVLLLSCAVIIDLISHDDDE